VERPVLLALMAPPAASERAVALPIWEPQERLPRRKAASEQRGPREVAWARRAPLLQLEAAWARRVGRTVLKREEALVRKKEAPAAWEMRAALPQKATQKPTQACQVSASAWEAG
jgi:hypothetical protein